MKPLLSLLVVGISFLLLSTSPAWAQAFAPGTYDVISCIMSGPGRGAGATGTLIVDSKGNLSLKTTSPEDKVPFNRRGKLDGNKFKLSGRNISTIIGTVVYSSGKAGYVTFVEGKSTGRAALTRR